jgi:hypothetical protein
MSLLPSLALGEWTYEASVDQFDGAQVHSISVGSEVGTLQAVLTLRCDEGKAPLFVFQTDEVIKSDAQGIAQMQLSVDSKEITGMLASGWVRSDQYQGAYTYAVKPVLRKLEGGEVLRIRARGVLTTFEAAFNIDGLADALAPIQEHCKL